jgi:hypothetical protein
MTRGNLGITLLQLDASDDQLAILRAEALQRRFVPVNGLMADGLVERRRGRVSVLPLLVQLGYPWIPSDPTNLVADLVDEGLPQIRLQRALVARLKIVEMPEGLHKRLLHQIFGIAKIAGPAWQAATCPPPERGLVPTNEIVERVCVALSGATQ